MAKIVIAGGETLNGEVRVEPVFQRRQGPAFDGQHTPAGGDPVRIGANIFSGSGGHRSSLAVS